MTDRQIVVGLFRTGGRGDSKPFDRFTVDTPLSQLHSDKGLKERVRAMVKERGYKALNINVLAKKEHGLDVVVGVAALNIPVKKKPVTRGGREIGAPVTDQRTMAQRRRTAKLRRGQR